MTPNPPASVKGSGPSEEDQKGVGLKGLPALFDMAGLCAGSGIVLTPIWFIYHFGAGKHKALSDPYLLRLVIIAFIAWLAFVLSAILCYIGNSAPSLRREYRRGHSCLTWCSICNVLGMTLLVWCSGGSLSPFLPLFVMTHTLTLASVRRWDAPSMVALLFILGMGMGIALPEIVRLADPKLLNQLVGGGFASITTVVGVILSVLVSTWSTRRNTDRRKVDERWKVIQSLPNYQDHLQLDSDTDAMNAILGFHARLAKKGLACRVVIGTPQDGFGATLGHSSATPLRSDVTLCFDSWRVLHRIQNSGRLAVLARAYISGNMSISGNFLAAARIADALTKGPNTSLGKALDALRSGVGKALNAFRTPASRILVRWRPRTCLDHYDRIPPKFYELFLGGGMQYTCAYWKSPVTLDPPPSLDDASRELNEAQERKLNFIASCLNLRRGASVLDVGCGWGGLCAFLAQRGCNPVGITNSQTQAEYSRTVLKGHGVDEASIHCCDFFDYVEQKAFDAVTVVGMLEHVPENMRDAFLEKANSLLKPGGRMYLQCITKSRMWVGGDGTRFLHKYVFPGFALEDISSLSARIKRAGFTTVRDNEDHQHYGRTALLWLHQIAGQMDAAIEAGGDDGDLIYRTMTAYLSLSAIAYFDGRGSLHRLVLEKPGSSSAFQPPALRDSHMGLAGLHSESNTYLIYTPRPLVSAKLLLSVGGFGGCDSRGKVFVRKPDLDEVAVHSWSKDDNLPISLAPGGADYRVATFADRPGLVVLDVGGLFNLAGTYQVRFAYESGAHGLLVKEVELLEPGIQ